MVKLSNPGEIDPDNISRPSVDELPSEDRQAYETFIKECEEENKRRKEKELEEKRRWFLSHFSKNRKGDISKDKEVVILSDEDEQAKSSATVSATTPPTLEQITQLVVNGQEKILATVQNMIDKSLGKQPLIDDSGTPRPNIDGTFYHNTMHLESSAAHVPQYGMPMNFYGQKTLEQYHAHGAVGPVLQTGQTGHGGPVPIGLTGSVALVAYTSSPESITSVPYVSAGFSRMNNSYTMPPRGSGYSYGTQCQIMDIYSKYHIHNRIIYRMCRINLIPVFKGQMILILIKYLRSIRKIWLLCLKKLSA